MINEPVMVAFIYRQLDLDLAAAVLATPGPWAARPVIYGPASEGWGDPEDGPWEVTASDGTTVVGHVMHEGGGADGPNARHIARHCPDRTRRAVTATRARVAAIVTRQHDWNPQDEHYSCSQAVGEGSQPGDGCGDPDRRGQPCDCGRDTFVEMMLRMIAYDWAGEAGYQDHWAPQFPNAPTGVAS